MYSDVARYSYFGSFRTDHGNTWVGPNVAFVNKDGTLTQMGSWYLGGNSSAAFGARSDAFQTSPVAFGAWASFVVTSFLSTYR